MDIYDIQSWGTVNVFYTYKIQQFENIALRKITIASPYVSNNYNLHIKTF